MKRVKIVNTITGTPVTVETSATTFGELKRELSSKPQFSDVNWGSTVCIQRDSVGRSTKSLDDELISSEEAFTMYISPSKHKGGIYSPSIIRDVKTKIMSMLDELIEASGEAAYTSASKPAGYVLTPGIIQTMDFDGLVEVIDTYNLAVDASAFDEYSDTDLNMLRAEVIAAISTDEKVKHPMANVPSKPASNLSYQEQKDLEELRRG